MLRRRTNPYDGQVLQSANNFEADAERSGFYELKKYSRNAVDYVWKWKRLAIALAIVTLFLCESTLQNRVGAAHHSLGSSDTHSLRIDTEKSPTLEVDEMDYVNVRTNANNHRIMSPLTRFMNRLMWGDFEKGDFGIIVHAPSGMNSTKYLPASYIHASMRFGNQIFTWEDLNYASALVIGTRFAMNFPNRGSQRQNEAVNIISLYPIDAQTSEARNSMNRHDGGGCFSQPLCLNNGTCLHELENGLCTGKCNSTAVPPEKVGAHMSQFKQPQSRDVCYYTQDRHGMKSAIAASNSIYFNLWTKKGNITGLGAAGWTEAIVTRNAADPDIPDAFAIRVPVERNQTLHDLDDYGHREILMSLEIMHTRGYGALPVMFYAETKGMDADECSRFWGGIDCNDGFRKEFFSQSFEFANGACISTLPESDEFYYFPSMNNSCSITNGKLHNPFRKRSLFINQHWSELAKEAKDKASFLGFTEDIWDADGNVPIYSKNFGDLSEREKEAAGFLALSKYIPGHPILSNVYSDLAKCHSSCSVKKEID